VVVRVDVLFFEGCPNHEPTVQLARSVVADLGLQAEVREVPVESAEDAEANRFLGSPSVRVNGRDIEPGAEERSSYALSCRMYGAGGVPPRDWIVTALRSRASGEPSANGTHGRKLSLATLPGIGAAFLPKIACPACWPAYAGFVSSAGLGFLLDTTYLLPLTATFLATAVGALAYRARERRGHTPFALGLLAAAGVLIGKFAFESDRAMYGGLAALVGASLWNTWPIRRPRGQCPECVAEPPGHTAQAHRRRA
jgi:mercuric ion transport protein